MVDKGILVSYHLPWAPWAGEEGEAKLPLKGHVRNRAGAGEGGANVQPSRGRHVAPVVLLWWCGEVDWIGCGLLVWVKGVWSNGLHPLCSPLKLQSVLGKDCPFAKVFAGLAVVKPML